MKYYLHSCLQPSGRQEEIYLPQVEPGSPAPEGCLALLLASQTWFCTIFFKTIFYQWTPSASVQLLGVYCLGLKKWGAELLLWLSAVSIPLEEGSCCCWNPKEIDAFAETPLVSLNGPEGEEGPAQLFTEVFIWQWLLSDPAQNHRTKAVPKGCTLPEMGWWVGQLCD